MSYDIDGDLNVIQRMIINNKEILALLDLTGATNAEIAKRIIKRSKWNDLATSDKRLCIYSVPARPTNFNPRTREGCDGSFPVNAAKRTLISIHAPAKGATIDFKISCYSF